MAITAFQPKPATWAYNAVEAEPGPPGLRPFLCAVAPEFSGGRDEFQKMHPRGRAGGGGYDTGHDGYVPTVTYVGPGTELPVGAGSNGLGMAGGILQAGGNLFNGLSQFTVMSLVLYNSSIVAGESGGSHQRTGGQCYTINVAAVTPTFNFTFDTSSTLNNVTATTAALSLNTLYWLVARWTSGAKASLDVFNVDGSSATAQVLTAAAVNGTLLADTTSNWTFPQHHGKGLVSYVFRKNLAAADLAAIFRDPWCFIRPNIRRLTPVALAFMQRRTFHSFGSHPSGRTIRAA